MTLEQFPVVTIDGPAASGKSSVSREVARLQGWNWVSTGAFYRGLAYVAHQLNANLQDEDALVRLAQDSIWSVQMTSELTQVHFKGNDVTQAVAQEEVGSMASLVSQYPKVRAALLQAQRMCALTAPGLVAEGRDCGTVVFPQAPLKIFLTASSEDRAARRAQEQGHAVEHALALQVERDQRDSKRKAAPMQIPDDAEVIDTTTLNLDQVVQKVNALIQSRLKH